MKTDLWKKNAKVSFGLCVQVELPIGSVVFRPLFEIRSVNLFCHRAKILPLPTGTFPRFGCNAVRCDITVIVNRNQVVNTLFTLAVKLVAVDGCLKVVPACPDLKAHLNAGLRAKAF